MNRKWKIVGLSFDHMHMGDLLRQVSEHAHAEIVGICDNNPLNTQSVQNAVAQFQIPDECVFVDPRECLEKTKADIAIICSATHRHAEFVEMAASYAHLLVEKPFASSLSDADRMIDAIRASGKQMVINWPLAWYPPHLTTKRLIDQGRIGDVLEVHYYDGNRGPTRHLADKIEVYEAEARRQSNESWWYKKASGGGSLLDYLGYGATLGTWFHSGKVPIEVTAMTWSHDGIEVDEHSITLARYDCGLSKFETRWGTFSDPWTHQPQPKCGFVIVGTRGTISSYDYESTIRVQTQSF
ncbi:MAG: Gfo/Idh/MocA family oxidoreductase, partial [Verrucomicrobia bacterium]|nr:Gfo/Idh/MocA family oxidoreductase [Verrucomicrobiota bacterium]